RDPTGWRESPPSGSASAPRTRGRRQLGGGPGRDPDDRTDSSCASLASRVLRVHRLKDSGGNGGNSSHHPPSGMLKPAAPHAEPRGTPCSTRQISSPRKAREG